MEKLTTEIFIARAKKVHGEEYNYSLVEYNGIRKKVKIICPAHGVFEQVPSNHINLKIGCPKCSQIKRATSVGDFTTKAEKIHGGYYDYSLVKYSTLKDKIKIICPAHGIFKQSANSHLAGRGCRDCYFESLKSNRDEFIIKSNKKHNDRYNYSLVKYLGAHEKVKIICSIHEVFEQTPSNHISGAGCLKCSLNKTQSTIQQMVCKSKLVHGERYDYSLVEDIGTKRKVKIICPTHGVFEQTMDSHMRGRGCPKCRSSHGEREVRKVLEKNYIVFKEQKTFDDCVNKKTNRKLPFDFYLPNYNVCIEFDGIQHVKMKSFGEKKEDKRNGNFLKTKNNDKIKNNYCKNKEINLLRIKHFEIKYVEGIISKFLNLNYEKK